MLFLKARAEYYRTVQNEIIITTTHIFIFYLYGVDEILIDLIYDQMLELLRFGNTYLIH